MSPSPPPRHAPCAEAIGLGAEGRPTRRRPRAAGCSTRWLSFAVTILLPLAPLAAAAAAETRPAPAAAPADPPARHGEGPASGRLVRGKSGVVVSSDPIASRVGLEVLRDGGNAIDAAVAVAFTMAVVYPRAGNLGGGGFLLLHDGGTGASWVVDFRETAPARATPGMYLDARGEVVPGKSMDGYLAVAVPGSVAGLELAHNRYGLLPWKRLVRPAVRLARRGFPVSPALSAIIAQEAKGLRQFPSSASIFLPEGAPPAAGTTLRQPDLARTLEQILEHGARGFYDGPVADAIVEDVERNGGILTAEDLNAYRPRIRKPIEGSYGSLKILVPPPPSSGGVIAIEIMNMLEPYRIGRFGPRSTRTVHVMAEVERRAYADRSAHLGDPDFFSIPLTGLLSKQYALSRSAGIALDRATPSSQIAPGDPLGAIWTGDIKAGRDKRDSGSRNRQSRSPGRDARQSAALARQVPFAATAESASTTHFAVVDRWHNAVAVTTTLNSDFGSKAVAAGTGVLLNNEMDDFSAKPNTPNQFGLVGGEANEIRPGKRPLSSMTPTIVLKNNEPYLVLGTPGGSTIITTVVQVLLNMIEFGMNLESAVAAPRVHHQWLPDQISIEEGALAPEVEAALRTMGHTVVVRSPIGDLHAIRVDPARGILEGACDPRGPGEGMAY